MNYVLQVDFPHNGPFGEKMSEAMADMAKDIAKEEGIVYKLWIENEETKEAGGIYLFDDIDVAKRYLQKYTNSPELDARVKIFKVNESLSRLSKANI